VYVYSRIDFIVDLDGVIYNVVVDCPEGGIAESEFKNNFLLRYLRDGSRKTIDLNMYSIVANGKVVETRQLIRILESGNCCFGLLVYSFVVKFKFQMV
jgi:hypothetical protein